MGKALPSSVIRHLSSTLEAERGRLVLWVPVALMAGISLYFALPTEPARWIGPLVMAVSALIMLALRRRRLRWLVLPVLLAGLGFSCAQWRTQAADHPRVTQDARFREITGRIGEIIVTEDAAKLIIEQPVIEGMEPDKTPQRIRVSMRRYDPAWRISDQVTLHATLFPLPKPAYPGGYDFGRYFYFQDIGAVGFAPRQPEHIEPAERSHAAEWLNTVRHSAGEQLRAAIPGASGAIAEALTVGEMGAIPKDVNEAMRTSGLSHILSISGLHLAIAAGIVFFVLRLGVTLVPRVALRVDARKIAAGGALLSSFVYLMLAGAPVPAQRSFVMVAFALTAILIDRKGISLNALAWAATGILLVFPDSMLGASFQMSFAATLAIISFYERFGHAIYKPDAGWARKIGYMLLGAVLTSLVASLATTPFVIYHFNRFSMWGVLSNMMVMPLTSLLIMPGVVLTLVTLPFGIVQPGAWMMEKGIDGMVWIAQWVSALPLASIPAPSLSDWGLVVVALGLLMLTLLRSRVRVAGFAFIAAGFLTMTLSRTPDVFISDDLRQVMVKTQSGDYVLLKGANRGFTAQAWLRVAGAEKALTYKQWQRAGGAEDELSCSKTLCRFAKNGQHLLFVLKAEAFEAACAEEADILLAWRYADAQECKAKRLVARRELARYGAHTVWLEQESPRIRTVYTRTQKRPWITRDEEQSDNDDSGDDGA